MLHSIQSQQHGGRRSGSGTGRKYHRQGNPFFRRPYIQYGDLKRNRIENITLTKYGADPESFVGNIWTIKVHNKKYKIFSKNASDCTMDMKQLEDGVDLNESIELSWKNKSLITTCNYPGDMNNRDDYTHQLPIRYVARLGSQYFAPTIVKGSTNEIMLAFTFPESELLYVISKPVDFNDVISIPLNDLEKYQFLLRFHSIEYNDNEGKFFRLKATSWDDVGLKWDKS